MRTGDADSMAEASLYAASLADCLPFRSAVPCSIAEWLQFNNNCKLRRINAVFKGVSVSRYRGQSLLNSHRRNNMNNLNIPGFTAESSLPVGKMPYQTSADNNRDRSSTIIPQLSCWRVCYDGSSTNHELATCWKACSRIKDIFGL